MSKKRILLLACILLWGCGQKGPLKLPEKQANLMVQTQLGMRDALLRH